MRKFPRIVALAAASLLALAILVVSTLLGYRAILQQRNAEALAIHTPNGIEEALYIRAGGIEQWLQIRGEDRRNPVILCLNGGPGASWVPLTLWFQDWEKDFTIVQWDQRGEGKTLEKTGLSIAGTMSVDRMTRDGIEVAEFLRGHLHKDKIILLGHSWGSILGVHMVKDRPDLFSAYVGTGQVSNLKRSLQLSYRDMLAKARSAHDARAMQALEGIGPPPYDLVRLRRVGDLFNWLGVYAPQSDRKIILELFRVILTAPNYSLRDIYYRNLGFAAVPTPQLYEEMLSADLSRLGPDFKVPIYFFQGAEDNITRASQAKEYFETIRAPHKEFVPFEGGGHFAVWSMRERFLQELEQRLNRGTRSLP